MKGIHILLFTFFAHSVFCQEWKIGLSATPEVCVPSLRRDRIVPGSTSGEFRPDRGFSIGAIANLKLTKRFELGVGLSLARPSFIIAYYEKPNSDFHSTLVSMNPSYVKIPLSINFVGGDNSFQFVGTIGLAMGIRISKKTKYEYFDIHNYFLYETVRRDAYFPPFDIDLCASAGGSYQIGDFTFRILPTYRYGLFSYKTTSKEVANYGYGVNLVVLYDL